MLSTLYQITDRRLPKMLSQMTKLETIETCGSSGVACGLFWTAISGRSPAGLVGSAQPDIGLARLVGEIQSREIAISLDYIARLGRLAPPPLFATQTLSLAPASFIGVIELLARPLIDRH